MTIILRALAAAALIAPALTAAPASAAPAKAATATKTKGKAAAKAQAPARTQAAAAVSAMPEEAPVLTPSPAAARVIAWVTGSKNSYGLPFAVIDKTQATLFLFDAKGQMLGAEPVLIGIMPGDEASPGVGSKKLADLGPAEKTTPAGRYLAKFGLPVAGERVLWVDYTNSVAIHPIPADAGAREKRRERMLSPTPDDNRITFGCINVPRAFYAKTLRPLFRRKGGYVYIMPDTLPLETVFPRLRVQAVAAEQAAR